jgi:phosphocarrier protein
MVSVTRFRVVRIANKDGLNLRVAALLSQQAQRFPCEIRVSSVSRHADAKSVWELLGLIAMPGSDLRLEADGPRSREALDSLATLISHQLTEESAHEVS